jgi:hypothetical protein
MEWRWAMSVSVRELTQVYILIDSTLISNCPWTEPTRRQLELLRDEIGEKIVSAVRNRMKQENDDSSSYEDLAA